VKSFLTHSKAKTAVLTGFRCSEFLFSQIQTLKSAKICQKAKYRASELVKMAFFDVLTSQKLISRKI